MIKRLLITLFVLSNSFVANAGVSFVSGTKYYITCNNNPQGYVCLGENHNSSAYIYYQSGLTSIAADGYWYIEPKGTAYTFRNAQSGQFLSWTSDRVDVNYKYMILSSSVNSDNELWTVEEYDKCLIIRSVANPMYIWNTRTNGLVGTYSSSNYDDRNSQFNIYEENSQETPVQSITLDYTALKIPVGKDFQIHATIAPKDATNQKLTWSSSNNNVATFTNGTIFAKSAGQATLTVSANDGSGVKALCNVDVYDPKRPDPSEACDTTFVWLYNGRMLAFPDNVVTSRNIDEQGNLDITTHGGDSFSWKSYELKSVERTFRGELPYLTSYKFNNKFNDQLMEDIEIVADTVIVNGVKEPRIPQQSTVMIRSAIGKMLTPSYKTSTMDAFLYQGTEEVESKVTRTYMDDGITRYVVAPRGYKVYAIDNSQGVIYDIKDPENPVPLTPEGELVEMPYGRPYDIDIQWATDRTTAQYGVPTVYITTDDGLFVTSKTVYKSAKIRIDGAGIFDDFPETAVSIRGRGNSSWSNVNSAYAKGTSSPKNPYRLKFSSKKKILGMNKGKNWVLLANKQYGSMTTNALAMKVADMVGSVAANHIVPVELYINGDYRGSYNMTEKVGFSNNSIDLLDESSAFLLQLDTYSDTWQYNEPNFNVTTQVMEPDLDDEMSAFGSTYAYNHYYAIRNHWNNFTKTLKNGRDDYDQLIDIDAYTRSWLVTDLVRNQEAKHPKSWYVYNENGVISNGDGSWSLNTESPYIFGPVWDFDWAYGYDDGGHVYYINGAESDIFSGMSSGNYGYYFFDALRKNSETVKKEYYRLWTNFIQQGKVEELLTYCDDYYNFARKSLEHNAQLWGDGNQYATVTSNSKNWLRRRANWLYSKLPTYDLSDQPEPITLGDVNEDGAITNADVICVVNHILGLPNDNFEFTQADVDGNGIINMRDAVGVIDLVMLQTLSNTRQLGLQPAEATLRMDDVNMTESGTAQVPMKLNLMDQDISYSGIQMDIVVPEGMTLEGVKLPATMPGFTVRYQEGPDATSALQTYRMIIYAPANRKLPLGQSVITLNIATDRMDAEDGVITTRNVMMTSQKASDYRLTATSAFVNMGGDATGISKLQQNTGNDAIYNLNGQRVQDVNGRGFYIIGGRKVIR